MGDVRCLTIRKIRASLEQEEQEKKKKIQQLSSYYSLDIFIIMSLRADVISNELMQFPLI